MQSELMRPIAGIENRTAQEVFDIMCDRFKIALSAAEPELSYHCDVCTMPGYGDAPCSPLCDRPAPSVAVKAIEAVWKYSLVIESSVRRGDGPDQYAGVTEALRLVKEARSALSAQVQDVAGSVTVCVGEQTIARLRNGLAVEFDNGLSLIPSSDLVSPDTALTTADDEDIGPHEKALRGAVEPFLDWLEQREEGAHIKEVREGLIGVEDVIPDDHVVLGAHLRAQKDDGVLTIGHFRRLQAAYDGKLPAAPAKQEG